VAAAAVRVEPSTRRLSEVARHIVAPVGITDSLWFVVDQQCREWGDSFDAWQDGLGQLLLGLRVDGKFAATVGGATLSIPRQVAKTFIVMRIVFAMCALFPGLTVLWTAHHSRTSTQVFRKMQGYASRKKVKPHIEFTRATNGEQEIRFRNGSAIMFGARSMGFGRGFDEVDVEVFDEAQILDEKALEDMIPATNQSRFEHGALVLFMGTPPRPTDPGEVFTNRRKKALAAKADDVVYAEHGNALYVECSADANVGQPGGPSLDNPDQLKKANPSYPHRTPQDAIDRLREQLPSDDGWRREGLGVWDVAEAFTRAIPSDVWTRTGGPTLQPSPDALKAFGVAFSQDGLRIGVGGAVKRDDGVRVELIGAHSGAFSSGLSSLAEWLAARWRDTAVIVISGGAGAGVLKSALRDRGVPEKVIHVATTPEYTTSAAMLLEGLLAGTVTHLATEGQAALDESVAVCDKKARGTSGAWGWTATTPGGDETPTEAVSLALWGAKTTKRRPGRTTRGAVLA
jgi:hypothetical protein